jgi:predicted HAD superfamily Cof-like phosphohydrolase
MYEHQRLVREFHKTFGLTVNEQPTVPSERDCALRVNLNMEETGELLESAVIGLSMECYIKDGDEWRSIVGCADACADLIYVISGAALTYGVEIEPQEDKIAAFGFGTSEKLRRFPADKLSPMAKKAFSLNSAFAAATIREDPSEAKRTLQDLLDFTHAVARACGIKIEPVFAEVQRSNMSKLWEDGTVHRRESDGKILKPPTYSPADIDGVLKKQAEAE